jgi:hypothetical protein
MFGNWESRSRYFVRVKDGQETHFKMAVKSFDQEVQFTTGDGGLEVSTKMDEVDLTLLTSVKNVRRLTYN